MSRKKIFISHCSDDTAIMDAVSKTLPELFSEYDIFNTYEESIKVGKDRAEQIRENLKNSDFMIAFVTDAYLRSVICISEISSFWLQEKPIFPVIYNGESGQEFLKKLTGSDRIFFDVRTSKPEDLAHELLRQLPDIKNPHLTEAWALAPSSDPDHPSKGKGARPYIGSESVYMPILQGCSQFGIVRMQDRTLPSYLIKQRLLDEKPESIWMVGTTNRGFIQNYAQTLAKALAKGTDVYCLIADKDSEFCKDVGAIEAFPSVFKKNREKWQKVADDEADRLSREFDGVRDQLRQINNDADRMANQNRTKRGHLYFGCTFTLIRQTVIMAVNETENKLWAWLSVTIPPRKAADGTLGIEVYSLANDGDVDHRSLAECLYSHVKEIKEVARFRGCLFDVQENNPERFIPAKNKNDNEMITAARLKWEKWYAMAEQRMARKKRRDSHIDLIEVAAQHPLKDGLTPDTAFKDRLDFAIELYEKLKSEGRKAHIYVPGSIHIPDKVSLSSAGIRYLIDSGQVDTKDILDETINEEYKGEDGVYNSADECYVAAEIYKEGSYYDLYCVCSSNQMLRKKLFYFYFGVIPKIWALPDDSFHNDMNEVFESIPDVLLNDPSWQDETSHHFIRTRKERMPGWK